jgi:hypothetical protein
MAGLKAQLETVAGNNTWVDSDAYLINDTGTAVLTATPNSDGEALADVYVLTFSAVVPGTSATVHVATQSANNPYSDTNNAGHPTGVSVALDGTTVYSEIVPGVGLVFSAAGGFSGTWQSTIKVGFYAGALPAFGTGAGVRSPTAGRRVRVVNTGTGPAQNCAAKIIKMVKRYLKTTHGVFLRVQPFAAGATEKMVSSQVRPYAITLANVTGSGGSKTMDVLVDGSTVTILNLNTAAVGPSTGLNVNDTYRITAGALTDVEFQLNQNAVVTDAENLLVFGSRYINIAPDVTGAAGAWGTSDVALTQSGQSAGTILASGVAYFWVSVLVPDGGNAVSNPLPGDVQLSGQVSQSAGWSL